MTEPNVPKMAYRNMVLTPQFLTESTQRTSLAHLAPGPVLASMSGTVKLEMIEKTM